MTAEQLTMYLTVPVIAALTGMMLAVIGGIAAGIGVVIKAVGEIRATVGRVDAHVNSEKTADQGKINTITAENVLLRDQLAKAEQRAVLVAQAASHAVAVPAVAPVAAPALVVPPGAPLDVRVTNAPADPVPTTTAPPA